MLILPTCIVHLLEFIPQSFHQAVTRTCLNSDIHKTTWTLSDGRTNYWMSLYAEGIEDPSCIQLQHEGKAKELTTIW